MKKFSITVFIALLFMLPLNAQKKEGFKVLISVDMEGITGVVNWEEVNREGKDYDYFRKIMTLEANAAIEGVSKAGATIIVVRDSHGSARNIIPDLLDKRALLLREWSGGPQKMFESIDETYDAVLCVGYHAKNGTPNATLDHTISSRNIRDVNINGISLPEIGINALVAGFHNVPVIFVAGDQAICDQSNALFDEIETVAVKKGIGNAALNLHPEVAREKITEGAEKALLNLKKYKPYKLTAPYTLKLTLLSEQVANEKSYYPGVVRTGEWELTFKSDDLMKTISALVWMY